MKTKNSVRRICFQLMLVFAMVLCFSGCVTNYNVHTFSNDVETLSSKTIRTRNSDGTVSEKIILEGQFTGTDYETVMRMAKDAGFTKVLSVEYGTNLFLGFIGTKWVTIRCSK